MPILINKIVYQDKKSLKSGLFLYKMFSAKQSGHNYLENDV